MNLDYQECLMIAMLNREEPRENQVEQLAEVTGITESGVRQRLTKLKQHGYVVVDKGSYRLKPKAYNEASVRLEKYFELTHLGLRLLEDGFHGHSIGKPD